MGSYSKGSSSPVNREATEGAVEAPFDDLAAAPTPVQHLAPAPVVVTARLGATREIGRGGHDLVVSAVARRGMRLAPAHAEDLQAGIRRRLTARTIRARHRRAGRNALPHRSLARGR